MPIIEKLNVVEAYDNIADTFSGTRYKAWPSTIKFIQDLEPDIRCLEIGSGNGKNMIRDDIEMIGIDVSEKLVEIARNKGKNVEVGNGCDIKYPDNYFDVVFSIAVLHHVSTLERRKKFIEEMIRVCKPNGNIMLEVWSTTEPKFLTSTPIETMATNDRMVSFFSRIDNKTYDRYYYFFSEDDFRNLIKESYVECDEGIKKLDGDIYHESNNWIFLGKIIVVKK